MDLTIDDSTTDLDLTPSNYNMHSNNISRIAIFLILILIILLIIYYVTNFSINNFEPNLNSKIHTEINTENKSNNIEQILNKTNQKLNDSINNLTNLKNHSNSDPQIVLLENNINTLKSEIIILQAKLLDQQMNNSQEHKNQNIDIAINTPKFNNQNSTNDIIIYDPIANYDRLKLTDPLVDPRGRSSADQIPTPQVAAQLNFPTQGVIDRYHRVGLLIADDKYSYDNHSYNNNYDNHKKNRINRNVNFDNINNKYNGVEIVSDTSLSNKNNIKKTKKTRKNRKNKKEHFEIEGFETEDNYETFDVYDVSDDDSENSNDNSSANDDIYENFSNSNKKSTHINFGSGDNDILELIGKKITDNWYKYFTSISVGNKIIKINVHNRNRRELYSGDTVYIPELGKKYKVKIDKMDMIEYNPYFF